MKKLLALTFFGLLALARPVNGQTPVYQNVIFVGSAPSGACTNGEPAQIVISTGAMYTCQTSTWGTVGGGGGGMTWPATPGIAVCTGTPCTAWTTSLSPTGFFTLDQTTPQTVVNGYPVWNTGIQFENQGSNPSTPSAHFMDVYGQDTTGSGDYTRLVWRNSSGVIGVFGRDNQIVALNSSGSTITVGEAVYVVSGNSNNIPVVAAAEANSTTTAPAIGVSIQSITNGSYGIIEKFGILGGLNTSTGGICGASACTTGQALFLSPTTAGALTNVRPSPPNYAQVLGRVLYIDGSNGGMEVTTAASLSNHDSGTDQATFSLPAGGVLSSRDTGTPSITFSSNALTLSNGAAATTQSAGDNSTKVATTAYVNTRPVICGVGLYNGGAAITAGTYTLPLRCYNGYGSTYTITGVKCAATSSDSSTANVSDSGSNALLTGVITPTANTWVAGNQSATTTIASGVWTTWTIVAGGTSTAINCVMTLTY